MSRFQECLQPQGVRAVLLSIKPRFADQILAGTKRVEFRRSWAKEPVGLIVIYASSPVQRIVGMVEVQAVVAASPTKLWKACETRGPGLPRKEFMDYFAGKADGNGILLGKVTAPPRPIAPRSVLRDFRAPQSFRYLTNGELRTLGKKLGLPEERT